MTKLIHFKIFLNQNFIKISKSNSELKQRAHIFCYDPQICFCLNAPHVLIWANQDTEYFFHQFQAAMFGSGCWAENDSKEKVGVGISTSGKFDPLC